MRTISVTHGVVSGAFSARTCMVLPGAITAVVALYILPGMSRKLVPELDELKPGSRAVIHCFAIPGVKPDKVVRVTSAEDDVERPVYLYTVPLAREKPAGR